MRLVLLGLAALQTSGYHNNLQQQEWTTVNDFARIAHVHMEKCIWLTRSPSSIVFKHRITCISMTSLLYYHHAFLLLLENEFDKSKMVFKLTRAMSSWLNILDIL